MTLSPAAERMIARIAEAEMSGKMLAFKFVDYRVYPNLMKGGLVAASIYIESGGVCFTPKGRALAKKKGLI